jgi:hypothetical protein
MRNSKQTPTGSRICERENNAAKDYPGCHSGDLCFYGRVGHLSWAAKREAAANNSTSSREYCWFQRYGRSTGLCRKGRPVVSSRLLPGTTKIRNTGEAKPGPRILQAVSEVQATAIAAGDKFQKCTKSAT